MTNLATINYPASQGPPTMMDRNYYTPEQATYDGISESRIEWRRLTQNIKNLLSNFKKGRGNNERAAHIQVCE